MRFCALALFACSLFAQAPVTRPEFDVASVKPGDTNARQRGIVFANGQFTVTATSLRRMIEAAYGLLPMQVTNVPGWVDSALWDIRATAPGAINRDQTMPMLQRLLEERFGLRMSKTSKEQDVLALLTRGETKIKPTETPGRFEMRVQIAGGLDRSTRNEFQAVTMARLAGTLARETGRMVIDATGLTGEYDFALQSEREVDEPNAFTSPLAPRLGSIGLRLESRKAMVDFFAIEKVQQPSEN